ncbi:HAD family hydrolase [Mycobacteroides abscessus]|uniref:HAD family hydrolase n=1 Tax=Mycobacteroides abscessus TaxID=36809 RepID=UPI0010527D78|nr:HAD family hydrolase [Mycobacteroides abscessus]
MAAQSMIGPIQVQFRSQGHRVVMSTSDDQETVKRIADETELLENVEVPRSIELTTSGGANPDMYVRVELRDGSPVLTELSWKSGPGQSDIQQKHLRQTTIAKLVTDLVVSTMKTADMVPVDEAPDVTALRRSKAAARKFVDRQQLPRARRVMTPEFLQEVAKVYRENIDGHPTKAVEETFNVRYRMAGKYVESARQRGYLSQTVRGQKKA